MNTAERQTLPNEPGEASPTSHSFSVLWPLYRQGRLNKTIHHDGSIEGADPLARFFSDSRYFPSLKSFHHWLRAQILGGRPHALVYGYPAFFERAADGATVYRRQLYNADRTSGFIDLPSELLVIDIDRAGTPEDSDWIVDPDDAVETLVHENLPEWFHDVSFVWAWTASHGLRLDGRGIWTGALDPGHMNVRLFFLLDRAVAEAERRSLLKALQNQWSAVDPAVAGTVQLIYIARPVRLNADGSRGSDPLDGLPFLGFVERSEDRVVVPSTDWLVEQGGQLRVPGGFVPEDLHPLDRILANEAFARLDDWVPALDIPRIVPLEHGYAAPAWYRKSGGGRPLASRKRQLEVGKGQIRDRGTGRRWHPWQLVALAWGCQPEDGRGWEDDAWSWLYHHLGLEEFEPWLGAPDMPRGRLRALSKRLEKTWRKMLDDRRELLADWLRAKDAHQKECEAAFWRNYEETERQKAEQDVLTLDQARERVRDYVEQFRAEAIPDGRAYRSRVHVIEERVEQQQIVKSLCSEQLREKARAGYRFKKANRAKFRDLKNSTRQGGELQAEDIRQSSHNADDAFRRRVGEYDAETRKAIGLYKDALDRLDDLPAEERRIVVNEALPVWVMDPPPGTGKSKAAYDILFDGSLRGILSQQTNDMNLEARRAIRAASGQEPVLIRGHDAFDPREDDLDIDREDINHVCRMREQANAVRSSAGDVNNALCRKKVPVIDDNGKPVLDDSGSPKTRTECCRHYGTCWARLQGDRITADDLLLTNHARLTSRIPDLSVDRFVEMHDGSKIEVNKELEFAVVDESIIHQIVDAADAKGDISKSGLAVEMLRPTGHVGCSRDRRNPTGRNPGNNASIDSAAQQRGCCRH